MSKEHIAQTLIRIKTLQDALAEETALLRAHISVGETIIVPEGKVTLSEQSRRDYNGQRILTDCLAQGIDPASLGEVILSIDRDKIKTALDEGRISQDFVDRNSSLHPYDTLRITPHAEMKADSKIKVASLLERKNDEH